MSADRVHWEAQGGHSRALRFLDAQRRAQRIRIDPGSTRLSHDGSGRQSLVAQGWRRGERALAFATELQERCAFSRFSGEKDGESASGSLAIDGQGQGNKDPLLVLASDLEATDAKALAEEAAARLEEIEMQRAFSFGRRLVRTAGRR